MTIVTILCVTVAKSCSCPRRSLDPPEYFTGCTVSSPRQIPNRSSGLVAAREFGRRSAFSPIPADLRPRSSRSAAISVFAYILLTGDRGFEAVSLQRRVFCEPDFLDQGCARAPGLDLP